MGTVINVITVLLGSIIGYLVQYRFSDSLKQQMLQGVGLVTLLIGIQMGLKSENILYPLAAIMIGGMVGYGLKLEQRLDQLAKFLGDHFAKGTDSTKFMRGFVTASLIFCVGPMTILGAINDGLSGDYQLLTIKSMLDGFTSIALTATLGIGVIFSILTIIVIQGGFTLLAMQFGAFFSAEVINETTAAGGILIIGLGIMILELRQFKIANFLPAIFIVSVLMKIIQLLVK